MIYNNALYRMRLKIKEVFIRIIGIPSDHSENVMRFMNYYLFDLIDIEVGNIFFPTTSNDVIIIINYFKNYFTE